MSVLLILKKQCRNELCSRVRVRSLKNTFIQTVYYRYYLNLSIHLSALISSSLVLSPPAPTNHERLQPSKSSPSPRRLRSALLRALDGRNYRLRCIHFALRVYSSLNSISSHLVQDLHIHLYRVLSFSFPFFYQDPFPNLITL